ncbi:MAG: YifB family Mg chelatase-like AAA ATPase [Lachnospiraceae bacterium]|nr:YifB family Mg chelatase-like AAA ATPase [Lachnospiraceae bacterium]
MYSKVTSGAVYGVECKLIQVETDVSDGLPMFEMVGFLNSCVKEAKERVRTAMKNSDFSIPPKRITVNLSPADIRKEGSSYDLPIAISILLSMNKISQKRMEHTLMIGELGLNGTVKKINGVLSVVHLAKECGLKECIVPKENEREASIVNGIKIIAVESLREAYEYLAGFLDIKPSVFEEDWMVREEEEMDYSEICGQTMAKRAIEIAVAGKHNVLLAGPPGAGKSMMAQRIPTIMPDLSFEESLEITKIYSISGMLKDGGIMKKRPFRSPHHTIPKAALAGGGRIPKVGEITLSHGGVLFLDELLEFDKSVIEVLRQPLEEKKIVINRIYGNFSFPADFMLVAALNPCPCGNYPDMNRCTCTPAMIRRYQGKISQAFLERIDINVEVSAVKFEQLNQKGQEESSRRIKERVEQAIEVQRERYKSETIFYNSQMNGKMVEKYCNLEKTEKELLKSYFEKRKMSVRSYHRVLKVARTIADLSKSEDIKEIHLLEALSYRNCLNQREGEEKA